MCIDIEMRSERNTGTMNDSMNIINENHNCSASPTLFKPSHSTVVVAIVSWLLDTIIFGGCGLPHLYIYIYI